jgi:hypothetical protein
MIDLLLVFAFVFCFAFVFGFLFGFVWFATEGSAVSLAVAVFTDCVDILLE